MKHASTASDRRWIPLAVAAAALVIVGAALLVARTGGSASEVGPDSSSPSPGSLASPRSLAAPEVDAVRDELPAAPVPVDAERFLAEYWGKEWPRIESELRKIDGWADYDLSKLPLPPPLEVALPKLREQVTGWDPDQRASTMRQYLEIKPGSGELQDRQWIQTKYARDKPLGPAEFAVIDAHVGPSQRVLEQSAGRIADAILEAKVRLFDQGDRLIAPYSLAGVHNVRDMQPGLLSMTSLGWEGWGVSLMVLESDVPGWTEMRAENLELIRERNRALKEIIATL